MGARSRLHTGLKGLKRSVGSLAAYPDAVPEEPVKSRKSILSEGAVPPQLLDTENLLEHSVRPSQRSKGTKI